MGMAASQARLLSLTSRLSDLEYRSQVVSNEKMALARQSEAASDNYMAALDSQVIKVKNNEDSTYVTATAANLTTYNALGDPALTKQRMLKTASGQIIVSQDIADAYESAMGTSSELTDSSSDISKSLQNQILWNTEDGTSAGTSLGDGSAQLALRVAYYNYVSNNMTATSAGAQTASVIWTCGGYSSGAVSTNAGGKENAKWAIVQQMLQDQSYASLLQQMYNVDSDAYNSSIANTEGKTTEKASTEITNLLSGLASGEESFVNQFSDEDGNQLTLCAGYRSMDDPSSTAVSYYSNLFEQMQSCGYEVVSDSNLNDSEWLYEQFNNGNIYLSEYNSTGGDDGDGAWEEVSYSSGDSEITTTDNTKGIAMAEAEYEKTTAEISAKDERYDLQLKNIDTEHSAVQTEIDSVKKVIDKNIERSFKMFDA